MLSYVSNFGFSEMRVMNGVQLLALLFSFFSRSSQILFLHTIYINNKVVLAECSRIIGTVNGKI